MQPVKLCGQPENSASLCSHQGVLSNPEKTQKPSDQKSLCGPLSLYDSPLIVHRCTSSRTPMTCQPPQEAFPRFHIKMTLSTLHAPTAHTPTPSKVLGTLTPYTPPAGSSSDLPGCQRLYHHLLRPLLLVSMELGFQDPSLAQDPFKDLVLLFLKRPPRWYPRFRAYRISFLPTVISRTLHALHIVSV